jgi:hypothetical protein
MRSEKMTKRSLASCAAQVKLLRLQEAQQALVAAEAWRRGLATSACRLSRRSRRPGHFACSSADGRSASREQLDALLGRFQRGLGAGEQRLLHADALQFLLACRPCAGRLGKRDIEQGAVGGFSCRRGGLAQAGGLRSWKSALTWSLDVLLEAPDDQAFVAEVVGRVVVGVGDGRRVEQRHQRREAARRAVVRRGRQQDQRVGAGGQQTWPGGRGATGRFTGAGGHVVAFVDDDDVPPGVLEVVAVLEVALERVDRDDAAVEVVERVVVGRDAVAHPGQAHRVQPHQRDGKAAPPFLLELGEHAFWVTTRMRLPRPRWISSVASTPASRVLPRPTASAIRMRERGWRSACKRGVELVGHQVHHAAVAEVDLLVVGDAAAPHAFQVEVDAAYEPLFARE